MAVRPVEFLELKKSIPADTTAVLYFHADDGLYIFVASRDNDLKIHKVAVNAKDLQKSVLRTRRLIAGSFLTESAFAGHPENFRWNDPPARLPKAHTAPEARVEPPASLVDRTDRKGFAGPPCRVGHRSGGNFALRALPRSVGSMSGKSHFVAEQRQECVNLGQDLRSNSARVGKEGPSLLYALGNPDGSLPGAEREVKSIAKSFPNSRQFIGAEASAAKLRKLEPDTGYVHLATHGELWDNPKNSYLVMAGKGEEGKFRATDIYKYSNGRACAW